MALVIFRSRAASQILMQSESARQLLDIIGKPLGQRGVIPAAELDAALHRLQAAVAASPETRAPDDDPAAAPVGLRQRAFPLLEMLRAASRRQVDITWGI